MKFTLKNGDTVVYKCDSFYVQSQKGDNVCINENPINIPEENRIFLENGDSFAVVSDKLYLYTKRSHIYVNGEKRFYIFPPYVSESFRDFCEQSLHIERKEIHGQSFVSANFKVTDISFKLISPSVKNGQYTAIFYDAVPSLAGNIHQNIENMRKKMSLLYHCHIEYSTDKNVLLAKMKHFDFNVMFQLIYSLRCCSEENQTSHFTA